MSSTHDSQSKIHVLMVTSDSEICGTERIILSLLRHLDRSRYSASLVTLFGPGDLVDEVQSMGYPAINLRMKEDSFWLGFQRWNRFLREHKPHVIQSLLIHSNLLGRLTRLYRRDFALLAGISTVYTVEGYGRLYAWIERYTHFLDTLYCVNSELGMKQVREAIRLPDKKLALVHNGLPLLSERADAQQVRQSLCRDFGLDESDIIVGIVAQLRPAKRHDILIHSIHDLQREFPNLRLVIVGQGEKEEASKALVKELGIERHVIFAGYRSDARQMLLGMDIFVLPSEVEGEPVSVMEAMDAGLPVVASATGGIPEIVEEGVSGYLSTPGDQESFTQQLRKSLQDAIRRKEMGEAGRKRIETHFSAERMTRQFEELYDRCYELRFGKTSPNDNANT